MRTESFDMSVSGKIELVTTKHYTKGLLKFAWQVVKSENIRAIRTEGLGLLQKNSHCHTERDIRRMAEGETDPLCARPIVAFEQTSGSHSGGRLVPYTAEGLAAFRRAALPLLAMAAAPAVLARATRCAPREPLPAPPFAMVDGRRRWNPGVLQERKARK